jgi:hypothetical protein
MEGPAVVNIWRAVHREVRSAWRSLLYDLRRPARAAGPGPGPAAQPPPVDADEQHPAYDAYAGRTRRVRTALVVAVLAVGGAATTYFGVVGGLAALLVSETGSPAALPGVSTEDTHGEQQAAVGVAGKAGGPGGQPAATLPGHPTATAESGTPGEPKRPILTIRPPRRTEDGEPPVPTPAPDPTPTCSDTPDPATPSPSPTPSAPPSPPPAPPE